MAFLVWMSCLDDKLTVSRARKVQKFMSQPFHVAEVFTGTSGKFVSLEDSIIGFEQIINGEHDDVPEGAFYMVGDIKEVLEKAKSMSTQVIFFLFFSLQNIKVLVSPQKCQCLKS